MAAPATLVRARVKEVVEDEFSAEGFTVADDKLLRAHGKDGTELAVSPDFERESYGNVNVLEVGVFLQVYLEYDASPDEGIVVDPSIIEGYGDRLRRAFQTESDGTTADLWFLRLTGIEYPDDPTGNKTRLEARFTARCENPAALG
jgi:hypothetical protein